MAKISANYEVVYIIDPAQSEEAIAATVAKFQTLAEQNGSDNDRNRYKSYLDCTCFEITERRKRHDDYQSGEQCGEHETHEFLPRCGS